jgi:DNA invertase Pin-like site-specific DNA recombinase
MGIQRMDARAIIYGAKSTRDRAGSIKTQLSDSRAMCEREGWAVADEFTDEGFSAYSGNRGPGLKAALARAAELAEESGEVVYFVVQHSDRISRGAGDRPGAADALGEIWHRTRRQNVHLRSVQPEDDRDLEESDTTASKGKRNRDDSKRKGEASIAGVRRAVERGEWRGGICPVGYAVERGAPEQVEDEYGRAYLKVPRKLVKHPQDGEILELVWKLASEGKSILAISLECSRRGYVTRPVRKDHRPKPFDCNRLSQILENPFYAGVQVFQGERFPGSWPTYVDIDVFERLKRERARRSHASERRVGRPAEGYLLGGLARCGTCGAPAQALTERRTRADGTRPRRYVCREHREHHRDAAEWCPAMPWDAEAVDRYALDNIGALIGDTEALRRQLDSGRDAESKARAREAAQASAEAARAEELAERAMREYADASDDDERELAKAAALAKRKQAEQARARMDAALDALNEDVQQDDPAAAMARLLEGLDRERARSGGDVKVLNATLREAFDAFFLKPGSRLCAPVFKGELLVAEIMVGRTMTPELARALEDLALPVPAA